MATPKKEKRGPSAPLRVNKDSARNNLQRQAHIKEKSNESEARGTKKQGPRIERAAAASRYPPLRDCAGIFDRVGRALYTEGLQDRSGEGLFFWIAVGNGLKPEKAAASCRTPNEDTCIKH
jgi:hypothetical protein